MNAAFFCICPITSFARRNAARTLVSITVSKDAVESESMGTRSNDGEAAWMHAAMRPYTALISVNAARTSSSLVTLHLYASSLDFEALFESETTLHPAFFSSATIAVPRYPVPPETIARGFDCTSIRFTHVPAHAHFLWQPEFLLLVYECPVQQYVLLDLRVLTFPQL